MALRLPILRRSAACLALVILPLLAPQLGVAPALAREMVTASAPHSVAVTIYRDPERSTDEALDSNFPRGFALITERRRVTLPEGEATVRFDGVTEGMIAVSALVTGLPHKVEEQNRNASLLSPASLVDGTLGNRVTVTRTNPATGAQTAEEGVVRTRADGGLVLQTASGFEAVRCSGLPEKLSFDSVPDGLSAQPVYSLVTQGDGAAHEVELTYLSWGFDWQAHHVARIQGADGQGDTLFGLVSWLTVVNSNGQSFADAELLVVAGTLNVDSNYENLAEAPSAPALELECYPLGNTAKGNREPLPPPPPSRSVMVAPAPPMRMMAMAREEMADAAAGMVAVEEALGDLKLFRVPEPVTVAAKGQKQVAFLLRDQVRGEIVYETICTPWQRTANSSPMRFSLESVNDAKHGLDASLPMGGISVFENGPYGDLLLAEDAIADTAKGQPVALALGQSTPVQAACSGGQMPDGKGYNLRAVLTNAKDKPVQARVALGSPRQWRISGLKNTRLKDGETVHEVTVPAQSSHTLTWKVTSTD